MATGYTWPVKDGTVTELAPFILKFARGIGYWIHQREESTDAPPRPPRPGSGRHQREIAKAKAELTQLKVMSVEDIQEEIDRDHAARLADRRRYDEERREVQGRYEHMIGLVKAWEVPDILAPVKEHALKQLQEDLEYEIRPLSHYDEPIADPTPEEWRAFRMQSAQRDIDYYTKGLEEESKWYEARVEATRALYESLGLDMPEP
jgi:hypothetical protein